MAKLFTHTALFTFVGLFLALTAHAQYTYQTVDVPFATLGTRVRGLSEASGNLSGTYLDANGQEKGWIYLSRTQRFTAVTQRGIGALLVDDHHPSMALVGRFASQGFWRAFTKHGRTFRELNIPSDVQTCSVNASWWIVCTVYEAGGDRWYGVFYDTSLHQVMATIEIPGASGTLAEGVNGFNDVAGGYWPGDSSILRGYIRYGFARDGVVSGQVVPIDAPCGGHTIVRDLNDEGLMAVTCGNEVTGDFFSYAYDGATWTELAVPGAGGITFVHRVNNLGQFAGEYQGTDGLTHGFVASPSQAMALAAD